MLFILMELFGSDVDGNITYNTLQINRIFAVSHTSIACNFTFISDLHKTQ